MVSNRARRLGYGRFRPDSVQLVPVEVQFADTFQVGLIVSSPKSLICETIVNRKTMIRSNTVFFIVHQGAKIVGYELYIAI